MATTQSAHDWLRPLLTPELEPEPVLDTPAREHDARAEIDRLRAEIEDLVANERQGYARDAVDSALASAAQLQVVTANLDACRPPSERLAGAALVRLADARLTGHADAIERGMTYTADNQMRLLQASKPAADQGTVGQD
jgi:hypothetical protein